MSASLLASAPRASSCARRPLRRLALWLLIGGLSPAFAAPVIERPLTLEEALAAEETESPLIAAREAAVTSADAAVEPAGALPDPALIVGVANLPVTGSDAFSLTRDFMTMRTVGVMQEFPRQAKRRARTDGARSVVEREQALLTSTRLSVRESIARAWIARASAERRLQSVQSLRPRARAQVIAATAALSSGRGSAADAVAAKASEALLADRLSQIQRDVDEARAELARWLPSSTERTLEAAPDWREFGLDPDTVLANVERHRDLQSYAAEESAAEAEIALARAEKQPDWSVEASFAHRGPRYSNMASVELRIPLPLFAAHRQDPVIASKQAALTKVHAEREDAQRQRMAELRKTLTTWRSSRERLEHYERELLPLADDRADVALAAYRGGRGDLTASIAALDAAIELRITYGELWNSFGQAWAMLHFAFVEERP